MVYFAIGDEDTVLGFGMAGVAGRIAKNADDAQAACGKPCPLRMSESSS
jgi:vacuolar-type H+-ATPase subunit F/Vma7